MAYSSEAAKVRDMPEVMQYITGRIADVGCGPDKITPESIGFDGRDLDGVTRISEDLSQLNYLGQPLTLDTIFSSHFLEHIADPHRYIVGWANHLVPGGHLVLYLPQKDAYNSHENLEHLWNWANEDFVFWFNRSFCGLGKDFRGNHLPKLFELVDSKLDIGEDRYSFYVIARKV